MTNQIRNLIITSISCLMVSACSDQWREVDPGATSDEILETMDRMQAQGAVRGLDVNFIAELRNDPTNTIYFKKSSNPGAFPETVMSLGDVSPFVQSGMPGPVNVFELGLQEVSVAFVDGVAQTSFGSGRHFALMIEMVFQGGSVSYFGAVSPADGYYFDEDEDVFEVMFTGVNGESLVLRTHDLSNDYAEELAATVKFDLFRIEANGQSTRIGQFAALAGFGG